MKWMIFWVFLFVSCLTPIDRYQQETTQILNTQHELLVDFIHWDKMHQLQIVSTAKTKSEAKTHLTTYRKHRDEFLTNLIEFLREEDPETLLTLTDVQKSQELVSEMRRQTEKVRQKIDEFERNEK